MNEEVKRRVREESWKRKVRRKEREEGRKGMGK